MVGIILQDSYCTCRDIAMQLQTIFKDIEIPFVTGEAREVVAWLTINTQIPDFIIADTEACDGNTIDILGRAEIRIPLILTEISPDEGLTDFNGLNIVGMILKPVDIIKLKTVMSEATKKIKLLNTTF